MLLESSKRYEYPTLAAMLNGPNILSSSFLLSYKVVIFSARQECFIYYLINNGQRTGGEWLGPSYFCG